MSITEREAIEELHKIRPIGSIIPQKRAEAIDMAINALEEIEQYKALGTVEELMVAKEKNIPTAYSVDEVVEKLKERTDFLKGCTKYGNKNTEQQAESYSTMMMYEVADLVDDLIEIVKAGRCF